MAAGVAQAPHLAASVFLPPRRKHRGTIFHQVRQVKTGDTTALGESAMSERSRTLEPRTARADRVERLNPGSSRRTTPSRPVLLQRSPSTAPNRLQHLTPRHSPDGCGERPRQQVWRGPSTGHPDKVRPGGLPGRQCPPVAHGTVTVTALLRWLLPTRSYAMATMTCVPDLPVVSHVRVKGAVVE